MKSEVFGEGPRQLSRILTLDGDLDPGDHGRVEGRVVGVAGVVGAVVSGRQHQRHPRYQVVATALV